MPAKLHKGFTLIELLIVIAVLGILAVAVLSAINPIEQINRSRDTGTRSDAEQLISAIDRFYASQGYYPWQTGADDTANAPLAWGDVTDAYPIDTDLPAVAALTKLSEDATSGTGELKGAYINRITATGYNSLKIYKGPLDSDSVYVCFAPKSKSFVTEADTRCDGDLPSDYPDETSEGCGNTAAATAGGCGTNGDCICLP